MKLRTRVAVVVITLFVGWVFALPYRHPLRNSGSSPDVSQASPLTLQIRPAPSPPPDPLTASGDPRGVEKGRTATAGSFPSFSAVPASPNGQVGPQVGTLRPVPSKDVPGTGPTVSLLGVEFENVPDPASPEHNASPEHWLRREAVGGKHQGLQPLDAAPRDPGQPSISAAYDLSAPKTWHRIVNGDNLPKLADTYMGDPGLALLIYEANRDVLVSPEILPIGKELRIPDPTSRHRNTHSSPSETALSGPGSTLMPALMPLTPRQKSGGNRSGWQRPSDN